MSVSKLLFILVFFIFVASLPYILEKHNNQDNFYESNAYVKIYSEKAGVQGTAVHIGEGFFLTSYHIFGASKDTQNIISYDGEKRSVNFVAGFKEYDVSLYRSEYTNLDYLNLDCSPLEIGDELISAGYAGRVGLIYNNLSVAKKSTIDITSLDIKELVLVEGIILKGMSGGPVISKDSGYLRGLNAGIYKIPVSINQFTGQPILSYSGMSFIVEGKTICSILDTFLQNS